MAWFGRILKKCARTAIPYTTERDCRPTQKQETTRFANLTRVFVLYITLPNVQNEDPLKIASKSPQNGSNVIVDRSRNKKQQDLRLSTNLTRVFVLYITLPKVQNEDPFKIVLKSLQNGSNMIVDRSRNKKQHDLRLSQHAGRYKIHTFKLLSNILLTK